MMGPVIGGYVPQVAADISASRTFVATTADGYLYVTDTSYYAAWSATTGSIDSGGPYSVGGQQQEGYIYTVMRGVIIFDTSILPSGAEITSAVLSIYLQADYSTTDFNLTVQSSATYPHNPIQAGDYYHSWYPTEGGSRSTSEFSGGYWNITLNDTGEGYISDSGYTRLMLRSSRDIDPVQPSGLEYVTFASRDQGESVAPKLYVNYDVAEGGGEGVYNYYFYGPYEDDGTVFNGTASVVFYPTANETIEFDLTADGVTADNHSINIEQQAVLMTWNISVSGNYSRVIYFTDDNTETVYVTVPIEDLPFYLYTFTVNDFEGVTNGYLESMLWIGSSMRTVERQPLSSINPQPFYMSWARPYNMRVVCDEGTLDVGTFTALTTTDQTIIIPYGAFDSGSQQLEVEVDAVRLNNTTIQADYNDPDELTNWLYILIRYRKAISGEWTTSYSANTTSANSYSLTWNFAQNKTDYVVTIQVLREGSTKTWTFSCPYQRARTNIWSPLSNLGNFAGTSLTLDMVPFAALVISSVLAFSFWHISAAAWIAWGAAIYSVYANWIPYDPIASPVVLGLGAILCVGITFGEFKKSERDI